MATKKEIKKTEDMEVVTLSRIPGANDRLQECFVSVNGKPIIIQRGKAVEVPRSVAVVLRHSELEAERADIYETSNTSVE